MDRPITIYLVDDDRSARKGLTRLLTAAGFNVDAFSSTEAFFQSRPFSINACLVIDAWVSDLSKMDLKTVFIEKNITVPMLFLSARDDTESRERARIARAVGCFRKPVDGPALLDAITWALETNNSKEKKEDL